MGRLISAVAVSVYDRFVRGFVNPRFPLPFEAVTPRIHAATAIAIAIAHVTPAEVCQLDPESVEPRRFLGLVPVPPLLNVARPPATDSALPAALILGDG